MEKTYEEVLEYNLSFYRRLLPVLEETGTGIALENGCYVAKDGYNRFFTTAEELAGLVDAFDHPLIGACWDTGHGHMQKLSQAAAIRVLGHRLKATHIHDNDSQLDQHLLPYQGTIDWTEVAGALKEIRYGGDFTYEAHNGLNKFPDGIQSAGLKFALELGKYVTSL